MIHSMIFQRFGRLPRPCGLARRPIVSSLLSAVTAAASLLAGPVSAAATMTAARPRPQGITVKSSPSAARAQRAARQPPATTDGGASAIAVWTLVVQLATAAFASYIAYRTLVHTAKPKVKVELIDPGPGQPVSQEAECRLVFRCSNVGHWYAKPAATGMRAYVNFDPAAEPIALRYGSALEYETTEVRHGKGGALYLVATGIELTHREEPEDLVAIVSVFNVRSTVSLWITLFSDQGDLGTTPFACPVESAEHRPATVHQTRAAEMRAEESEHGAEDALAPTSAQAATEREQAGGRGALEQRNAGGRAEQGYGPHEPKRCNRTAGRPLFVDEEKVES